MARPPAARPADAISVDEARRLYLETATPVRAIAGRLRMSAPAFLELRARLGWPARGRASGGRRPTPVRGLVERLGRQIGRRLAELEAADAAASAGEVASLLKALAELARLEQAAAPPGAGGGGESDAGPDPDTLREAIARRVEAFGAGGDLAGVSHDADAG